MVQERDDVVLIDAADPRPAAGLGGERPPRQLHRPARRLHQLQEALPPRQARRPEHLPELRQARHVHRGPPVQPDVQDPRRPGRGLRRRRLPAPGDGAGHVRQLRQRAADRRARSRRSASPRSARSFRNEITPQNWIFRTREFEQMEMEFFVPPADGAAVVRVLVHRAPRLVRPPRHPARPAAPAPARRRRAVALLGRHVRRRVPVPVGLRRARGHRPAHRLRPQASTPRTPASGSTTSTRRRTSATCRTSSSRPPGRRARWPRSCSRPTTRT